MFERSGVWKEITLSSLFFFFFFSFNVKALHFAIFFGFLNVRTFSFLGKAF